MLAKSLVMCCGFVLVVCQRRRDGRFLSFDFEDRDISVDLDFSIPFLTIPVKKTVNSFGLSELPTVNINPAALVLGSAIVLGTTIVLPLIMRNFISNSKSDYRLSRILDNTEFGADGVINFANQMLTDSSGLRGCTLRIACWTAQRQNDDLVKVVRSITNNKLLSTFINSTAAEEAMLSGRSGRDCNTYTPCPIREQYIPIMLNNLAILTRS